MNQPSYLWKNHNGIYFFRARIPKQFLEYFHSVEIKKSLKTDSLRLAIKLVRAYRVELDKELEKLTPGDYNKHAVTLKGKKVIHPTGWHRKGRYGRNYAQSDIP